VVDLVEMKKDIEEVKFSKEQLLSSSQFAKRKDLLCAVLEEGRQYTVREAETEIKKFLKRKVS